MVAANHDSSPSPYRARLSQFAAISDAASSKAVIFGAVASTGSVWRGLMPLAYIVVGCKFDGTLLIGKPATLVDVDSG